MSERALPTGTVTFLLTDIEGSTRLWQEHPSVMGVAVERHVELIEQAVTDHGGALVKSKGEGDSTFSVFSRPTDAVAAAALIQQKLGAEPWPDGLELRARAAVHTGEAELRDGDYYGTAVNRCARLRAIAHGGQSICSQTTADLATDGLPSHTGLRDLGMHQLRDLERPERIAQITRAKFPEEFPPLLSLERFRHNLPPQRTSFVGRESEVIQVRKLVAEHRLVTLIGVGGCGKTRLALQVAAELVDEFEHGVFFADLAPISDPVDIPARIARAVGVPSGGSLGSGGTSIHEKLLDFLASKHVLIVFDNCEHMIAACADAADEILGACTDVRILATSREVLEVDGEQIHSVPSLTLPTADDAAGAESVRLFCSRAAALKEDFSPTSDQIRYVSDICVRLDGMPLAIELAAAQITHLSPRQIADRLKDRFRLLTGGRRRVQRQQTLAATLDWSHELMTEAERTLFRRLAIFPASFTLEWTEALCADGLGEPIVKLVGSLVGKSLVVTVPGETLRYRMLETVRMYAEERLVDAGEAETARSKLRDHCVSWIEALPDHPFSLRQGSAVEGELDTLRAAISWSAGEGRADLVARLATRMATAMTMLDLDEESQRWLTWSLDRNPELTKEDFALAHAWAAYVDLARLSLGSADKHAESAIDAAGDADPAWIAVALGIRATVAAVQLSVGDQTAGDRAESFGRRVLDAAARSNDPFYAPAAQLLWGLALVLLGRYRDAADLLGEVADAFARLGGNTLTEASRAYRAVCLHLLGEHAAAVDAAREVENGLAAFDSDWVTADFHVAQIALAHAGAGDLEEAYRLGTRAVRDSSDRRLSGFANEVLTCAAAIVGLRGDWRRCSKLFAFIGAQAQPGVMTGVALYREYIRRARDALDPTEIEVLRAEGAVMTRAEAIELALEGLNSRSAA